MSRPSIPPSHCPWIQYLTTRPEHSRIRFDAPSRSSRVPTAHCMDVMARLIARRCAQHPLVSQAGTDTAWMPQGSASLTWSSSAVVPVVCIHAAATPSARAHPSGAGTVRCRAQRPQTLVSNLALIDASWSRAPHRTCSSLTTQQFGA